jgi:hypothetical protein
MFSMARIVDCARPWGTQGPRMYCTPAGNPRAHHWMATAHGVNFTGGDNMLRPTPCQQHHQAHPTMHLAVHNRGPSVHVSPEKDGQPPTYSRLRHL